MRKSFQTVYRLSFGFIFAILTPVCFAQQTATPTPVAHTAADLKTFELKFDQDIRNHIDNDHLLGVSLALIHHGKIVWTKGFGLADKAGNIPVTSQTVFQVASVSKSVAAWGVMRLVQDGKLELDVPVEKYLTRWHLPPSQFDNQGVTVRRLLSHTAGTTLLGYMGTDPDTPLPTLEQSLSGNNTDEGKGAHVGQSKIVAVAIDPGTKWSYSGGGYTLLQLLVEEATQHLFADYMQHAVLQPLGMKHSAYTWLPKLQPLTAKAYGKKGELLPNYLFIEQAAAGLYTTAPDLARFVAAQMTGAHAHPGHGVLEPDIVKLTQTPAPASGGFVTGGKWGLGPEIEIMPNGVTMVGHDGSNSGWKAMWAALPQLGEGVVLLTNSDLARGSLQTLKCDWLAWTAGSSPDYCSPNPRPAPAK